MIGRFVFLALTLGVVWWLFHLHPTTPYNRIDAFVLGYVSLVFGLAALIMMLGRRLSDWTARAVGLLLTSVGSSMIYGGALWNRLHLGPCPPGYPADMTCPATSPEWWTDTIRTLYIVGGTFLLFGLAVWTVDFIRRFHRRPDKGEIERGFYMAETAGDGDLPAWSRTVRPAPEGE